MDNSLMINEYIYEILSENEEILSIVGSDVKKVFPLCQPDNLEFPYVVFSRTAVNPSYTKDIVYGIGWYNTVRITVKGVSDDYYESLQLANAIRHSLETYRIFNNEISVHPIELESVNEYMTDDVFVQELNFVCMVECVQDDNTVSEENSENNNTEENI